MVTKTQRKDLISVGVDIGTTTSHLVFSKIVLEKDSTGRTQKFEVKEKEILYTGPIHFTPMLGTDRIDFARLRKLLLRDYKRAGFTPSDVDTGAVIITGESAKRANAEGIVRALAGETGKFVAATAGPNFEAVLAAYGAGAVKRSKATKKRIMNVDIGGGSSNIAICENGKVIDTAAINVGGRLIVTDNENRIVRLERLGQVVARHLGFEINLGDQFDRNRKQKIASLLAEALLEILSGKPRSELTKRLMMTAPLKHNGNVDEITFSGGVAEFIYGREKNDYNDLGRPLAEELLRLMVEKSIPIETPEHLIRATVIGAGQSSLQVSGSTTFLSPGLRFPIRNLPVVEPHFTNRRPTAQDVQDAIKAALKRLDLEEGTDNFVLAFQDSVRPSYEHLLEFGKGVVAALSNTVEKDKPILMCFSSDIGNSVGNVMKRETEISCEVLSIDELSLHEGEFVDIGEPIIEGVVVPVIVKTLVFGENKPNNLQSNKQYT